MKRTALVSVAFCASVMASGCAGESLEGFDQEALDQESIGSVQQAVTPDVGDWVDINCASGYGLVVQDVNATQALTSICFGLFGANPSLYNKVPIIISNTVNNYYSRAPSFPLFPTRLNRRTWYAVVTPDYARSAAVNGLQSCNMANAFVHSYFAGTWDSNTSCLSYKVPGSIACMFALNKTWCMEYWHQSLYYFPDYGATKRTSECNWIKAQTAFVNNAAAIGLPVASDCSNVVGFDPLTTASQCASGGWVC